MLEPCIHLPQLSVSLMTMPLKIKRALPFHLPKLSSRDCSSVFAFCIFWSFVGNRAGTLGYAGTVKANLTLLDWQRASSGTGPRTTSTTSISHCWKQPELSRNSPLWTFLVSIPVRINLSQGAFCKHLGCFSYSPLQVLTFPTSPVVVWLPVALHQLDSY